jgi:Xaa-Pro aminopeptidase
MNAFREKLAQKNADVAIIWEPDNQFYLSGLRAEIYSRPLVLWVYPDRSEFIVPALEEVHAKQKSIVDKLHVYYETYMHSHLDTSYLQPFHRLMDALPENTVVALELAVIPAEVYKLFIDKGFQITDITQDLIDLRTIKDEEEIYWLEIAGELSDIALEASFANVKAGMSELEFDAYGDRKLMEVASERFPNQIVGFENWTLSGQNSELPHSFSSTRRFQEGDVVVHSRQVWINGYRAENERTFILGEPTAEQKILLELAIESQRVGMEIIKPGIRAKDVDIATAKVFEDAGYGDYVKHRVGHGLGLSEHEEPYLRFDNDLILEEGMVYTIEPGVYVPELGGYRHSDTVILTKNGSKSITHYPRDLESMIIKP